MAESTSVQFIVDALQKSKGRWMEIANDTGVPYHTITKIAQGRTENPRINTVDALDKYFRKTDSPDPKPKTEAA
jgi:predicted transcriptional regulator